MEFEWDVAKATRNVVKHGIDFEDACNIFKAPVLEIASYRNDEPRLMCVGWLGNQLITVVATLRNDRIRIISARPARKDERRAYQARHA